MLRRFVGLVVRWKGIISTALTFFSQFALKNSGEEQSMVIPFPSTAISLMLSQLNFCCPSMDLLLNLTDTEVHPALNLCPSYLLGWLCTPCQHNPKGSVLSAERSCGNDERMPSQYFSILLSPSISMSAIIEEDVLAGGPLLKYT